MASLPLGRSYGVFQGNTPLQSGDFLLESSQDSIAAFAGGGQAGATQITTQTARVTTVATAADSVMLPISAPGLEILLINHALKPMQVFGQPGDLINDVASATGVSQMQNSFVLFSCATAGNWYTEGLATGFQRGTSLQTFSAATIAANSTATQASGTAVASMIANVTSAATGPYSVTLPVSAPGLEITIHNISAYSIYVFPNAAGTTTETINALSANASLTMATNTSTTFTCVVAGQWYTIPRVPS
jgi:hypothetical protein